MQKVALLDSRENAVHTPHFRENTLNCQRFTQAAGKDLKTLLYHWVSMEM